jgi:hypothetical protein
VAGKEGNMKLQLKVISWKEAKYYAGGFNRGDDPTQVLAVSFNRKGQI